MVQYLVYKASFLTKKGSRRVYVGMTTNAGARERALQKPGRLQPAWCNPIAHDLELQEVVLGVDSRVAALVLEAIVAAQRIHGSPKLARGGPWCRPTLTARDGNEISAVAAGSDSRAVVQVLQQYPEGSLSQHVGNVKVKAQEPSSAAAAGRGWQVGCQVRSRGLQKAVRDAGLVQRKRTSGRPGKSGHQERTRKGLQYGTAVFAAAK